MTRPNHKSDPKADALHAMAQIRSELSAARERQRDADTELRRVNAALSQSIEKWKTAEDRFNSLVTIIPDIVYRIDPDGIFVYVNNAVELLGYRPEELIDRHFSEIILPSDCEQVSRRSVLKSILSPIGTQTSAPKLFDERRTGQRRTTGLEIRLVAKAVRPQRYGCVERLSQSQSKLITAEKMGALGTLTAGIAHELNNPMMGMLNYIQYCIRKTDAADRRHSVLTDAEHEIHRCIDTRRSGDWAVMTVTDTGAGIPEQHRMKIFDPFYTTKPIGKGTGLGLPVSRGIVNDHDGQLICRSRPGTGSTFELRLPVAASTKDGAI